MPRNARKSCDLQYIWIWCEIVLKENRLPLVVKRLPRSKGVNHIIAVVFIFFFDISTLFYLSTTSCPFIHFMLISYIQVNLKLKTSQKSSTSASYMDISLNIDSGAKLTTWLYDKQCDFNFALANFQYTCNNITVSPACGDTVYISQIWLNFKALCLVSSDGSWKSVFTFISISNFFDLSITDETWVVEMRIWCIEIGDILVLHICLFDMLESALHMIRIFRLLKLPEFLQSRLMSTFCKFYDRTMI
jgi:hypothetical protein